MRRGIIGFLAVIGLGWGLAPMPAGAEVIPEITYEYYTVKAEEGRSLYESLFSATPIFHGDIQYMGGAQRSIKYQYKVSRPVTGPCRLQDIKVSCLCRITLPSLEGGDAVVRAEFSAYLNELKSHELEHCRLAAQFASIFQETVRELGDQKCDRLTDIVRGEYARINRELDAEQNRFDARTLHGQHAGSDSEQALAATEVPASAEDPSPENTGLRSLDDGERLSELGYYQDHNGVWRNRGEAGRRAPGSQVFGFPTPEEPDIFQDQNGVWRNR